MPPVHVLRSQRKPLTRSNGSEVEESSQPGSQSSDDNQITKLATEMQREARKRREIRRTVINDLHRQAVSKIENAMTVKLEDITNRIVKRHRFRMERFSYLVRRRSTIEAKMLLSSQNIENAYFYADKAIEFAFGRRLQSIAKQQKAQTA